MSTSAAAGDAPIAAIHPDIVQSHILNRLDGPTLAAAACASSQFLSLCNDDRLWKHISNSTWPSTADPRVRDAVSAFPSGHRSFFSDSFPARRHLKIIENQPRPQPETSELISAVDIYFDGRIIHSEVLVTETLSSWFRCTPFRLDLLDPKKTVSTPLDLGGASIESAADRFKISWILIDPVKNRAINVASEKAVEVRRHWLMDDVQLRFATVMAAADGELVQCAVVMTFGGKPRDETRVKEVSMQIEEMEGKIVTGTEGLGVLHAAMEGQKWKRDGDMEKDIYEAFMKTKAQFRERKQKREKGLDMVCIATGVSVFITVLVWITCLWRR